MSRPQLVLDVAGVLITNLFSAWQELADYAGMTFESFKDAFKREVREPLWKGKMSESDFWEWLSSYCPTMDPSYARSLIDVHLIRLPSCDQLEKWSDCADIHLLSNHRKEWIEEVLEPIKPWTTSITISSEVGLCKPDLAIYQRVHSQVSSHSQMIIYVDDQEKNLGPAKDLGWFTVLADAEGTWTEEITQLLHNQSNY